MYRKAVTIVFAFLLAIMGMSIIFPVMTEASEYLHAYAPYQGSVFLLGEKITISWDYGLGNGQYGEVVQIALHKAGSDDLYRYIKQVPAEEGYNTYKWTIPHDIDYNIQGWEIHLNTLYGPEEDVTGVFYVKEPAEFQVTSPVGSDTFFRGGVIPVEWQNINIESARIRIEVCLSSPPGTVIVEHGPMNTGSYSVPITDSFPESDAYFIRISDMANYGNDAWTGEAFSEGLFSVKESEAPDNGDDPGDGTDIPPYIPPDDDSIVLSVSVIVIAVLILFFFAYIFTKKR